MLTTHFGAVEVPWLYILFVDILLMGMCNAVNLTDGLDGLAAGTVMIVMIVMAAIAYRSDMLDSGNLRRRALAGACVGFLWFNSFPADIFMGDTGSLALGMALGCLAVVTKTEFVVIIIGGLFVAEALSVMIQVFYYKKTKKRIFLMAPAAPSLREEGLVGDEGGRALLDCFGHAGRARLRRVLRRNLDGGGIGYGEPEDACRQKHAPESLGRVLVLGLGKSGHDAVDYLMAQLGGRVAQLAVFGGSPMPLPMRMRARRATAAPSSSSARARSIA